VRAPDWRLATIVSRFKSDGGVERQRRRVTIVSRSILTRLDFVVLDEIGYLPFAQSGGQLLLDLVSRLYERTSIVAPPISPSANGPACSATPR
jgi:IstB-like ATP binding protein